MDDPAKDFSEKFEQKFEPGSEFGVDPGDYCRTHALTSIAFSLKRIADAVTYQKGPKNLFDLIRDLGDGGL